MLQSSTLRPGFLVSLSVAVKGNCKYDKRDIERDHKTSSGSKKKKWETTRTIYDPEEFERAQEAASKARSLIRGVCSLTNHGLLCPVADNDVLEEVIKQAQRVVDDFNGTASMTRVRLYVMTGVIADNDEDAMRKINGEIRELMDDMAEGIKNLDVKAIRDAASQAKQIGGMLTPEAEVRLELAIKTARDVAKNIVKAGEDAAIKIDRKAVKKIEEQRTAFLDLSDETEVATPQFAGRQLDLSAGE